MTKTIENLKAAITGESTASATDSVTRVVVKPTHMIGGYAQLAYGFNYYGTTGTNRDEFVIVRKMGKVDWLDGEPTAAAAAEEVR